MTHTGVQILHTEFHNPRARKLLAGFQQSRCMDTEKGRKCKWTSAGARNIRTVGTEHVMKAGHAVAVIDDGIVTTLVPVESSLDDE